MTAATIECGLVRDAAGLEELAADWERLWRAQPIRHVFQSLAWHLAILDAHGSERDVRVVVARIGARVVGVLPLCSDRGALRFLGAPYADYNDLLVDGAEPARVLAAMLDHLELHGGAAATLENVRDDALLRGAVAGLGPRWSRRCEWTWSAPCPTVLLDEAGAAVAEILKKKSLRRHENQLAKLGGVSLRHVDDADEARALLPEFFAQHGARRALTGEGALFDRVGPRRFYTALLARLGTQTVRFAVLSAGDTVAAFHFGFEVERRFVWYKPTFDVDLWDTGPGEVLLKKLFEYARDRGLVEFDFTRGDEQFKSRFANASRDNHTLHLMPAGLRAIAPRVRRALRRSLARRPRLEGAARRIVSLAAAARAALRRHGVLGVATRAVARAWRRWIHAVDEVIVFRASRAGTAATTELEVVPASLRELTALAAACPEQLDAPRLRRARERIRDGDRVFVARAAGELAHIAWLGTREEIVASHEVGTDVRLPLDGPQALIYDCWTPASMRGRGVYPAVLRALIAEATGDAVWIFCERGNHASRRGIGKAGFTPVQRMGRVRWFGRTRRTWLLPADPGRRAR